MTTRIALGLAVTLTLTGCASAPQPDDGGLTGLVVVEVKPEDVAAKAGLEVGDVLLAWSRADGADAPRSGVFVSPFDLDQVLVEEAPRGPVTITAMRAARDMRFELADPRWGLVLQPILGGDQDRALAVAMDETGADKAATLRELALHEQRPAARAWLLAEAAVALGPDQGEECWKGAVEAGAKDRATLGWVHERRGEVFKGANRFEETAEEFTHALECRPEGELTAARDMNILGVLAWIRGDLDAAAGYYRRSFEIRERLAPRSRDVSGSLNNLGNLTFGRGDLDAAEGYFRRSLEITERLDPGSIDVAMGLSNLGVVAERRSDLDGAEGYYRRSLEITERLDPGSVNVAVGLNNLGVVAGSRGDLEAAEGYYRRALEIKERLATGSLAVAASLNNLGVVAEQRVDPDAAEGYYRQSLEIQERLAPDSLQVAVGLNNLGNVAKHRGELDAADGYYHRALEIQERLAPGSLAVAACANNLGNTADLRGDLDAAEGYYRRSLEIQARLVPGSLEVGRSLLNLGIVAHTRGDLEGAETLFRQALGIYDLKAPGSVNQALTHHKLGKTLRRAGRTEEALHHLLAALGFIEVQQERLGGGGETRGRFRSEYIDFYRDAADLLLERGRPGDSVGLLERSRAQGLLALLAERDIVFSADVPAELERERRIARADYQRLLDRLGELVRGDEEERQAVLDGMQTVRLRQEDVAARIRATSPRLADLQHPELLDLEGVQAVLDQGTVLLYWSLGAERGAVVAVTRTDVEAAFLDVSSEEIGRRVKTLRSRLTNLASPEAARSLAKALADLLLGPVAGSLVDARRVILVPDGPLWLLPSAVLVLPGGEGLLVETSALSLAPSGTVLGQLVRDRRQGGAPSIIAFGDPAYPELDEESSPQTLTGALRSGLRLDPLPATRAEVASLSALYGNRARLLLGEEATEEAAKALGKDVTIIHLACHGLVNELRPLESALALSIPVDRQEGQENGLLQAWEIFESVRIDADLVTLSACQTALGKEVAGEGMVGLTRAFQYAGARTVLASLWSVADESTAELMTRFYRGLKGGVSKDEALRQAQLMFISGPIVIGEGEDAAERDLSHPFYWAAFQLYGDWK